MVKLFGLALLLSSFVHAVEGEKVDLLKETCKKEGGVFSQVDNDMIRAYTCRTMKGDLVGVYMPEQVIVLNNGDSNLFEKSVRWGKKI